MQEIIVHTWCDHCHLEHGARVDATIKIGAIFIPGIGNRSLDLCEVSDKRIFGPLRDFLGGPAPVEVGEPEQMMIPTTRFSETDCALCDKIARNRSALTDHVWNVHVGREVLRSPDDLTCVDCGFEGKSGTGLAAHRRGTHGFDALAAAYEAAAAKLVEVPA